MLRVWLATLLLSSAAFSCQCISFGSCPGLGDRNGPVFLGTVLSVTNLPSPGDHVFLSDRRVRLQVNESFGGVSPDTKEVEILTGFGGGDCGVFFQPGEQYLVDASIDNDGVAHASICSATRRIEHAGAALRILNRRRKGESLPSLIGQVARVDRSFTGSLETADFKPLANTLIRATTHDRTYEAQTDAQGIYEFYDLPAGKYEFLPDLPAGTTLAWYLGSEKPPDPFEFRAGCKEHNIDVFAKGSVRGRVLDPENRPLTDAVVYIVPVDMNSIPHSRELYRESQGKEGFFKFIHIPPGRYMVVVNPDDSRDPYFPYRRTFYPDVHERGSAGIVILPGAEQISGVDIHLPPPFPPRDVKVRVTWADGQSVRDSLDVTASQSADPDEAIYAKQRDKSKSLFDLTVLEGESYAVEAEVICRYSDERGIGPEAILKSNKVTLKSGNDHTEILLTVAGTGCPSIAGKKLVTGPQK